MALFPSISTLTNSFDPHGTRNKTATNYWINSSLDNVKDKASELTKEAEAELKKAGQAVKTQSSKSIKLYSTEYFLTCGLGGIFGKFPPLFICFFFPLSPFYMSTMASLLFSCYACSLKLFLVFQFQIELFFYYSAALFLTP